MEKLSNYQIIVLMNLIINNFDFDNKIEELTDLEYALESAYYYSNKFHMSKTGIYNQLIAPYGENLSPEIAQYAIDNLKVDYKINALKNAQYYINEKNLPKDELYEQLTSEYGENFTSEEAQYALDNLK